MYLKSFVLELQDAFMHSVVIYTVESLRLLINMLVTPPVEETAN